MKKILIASLLIAAGSSAFAATTNKVLGAATSPYGGSTQITSGDCPLLSATVTVVLSTGNIGNVSCNDTTANIGVAVGNMSGKGKIYSIGSSGGAVTTTDAVPSAAGVATQADAKSASSS